MGLFLAKSWFPASLQCIFRGLWAAKSMLAGLSPASTSNLTPEFWQKHLIFKKKRLLFKTISDSRGLHNCQLAKPLKCHFNTFFPQLPGRFSAFFLKCVFFLDLYANYLFPECWDPALKYEVLKWPFLCLINLGRFGCMDSWKQLNKVPALRLKQ